MSKRNLYELRQAAFDLIQQARMSRTDAGELEVSPHERAVLLAVPKDQLQTIQMLGDGELRAWGLKIKVKSL